MAMTFYELRVKLPTEQVVPTPIVRSKTRTPRPMLPASPAPPPVSPCSHEGPVVSVCSLGDQHHLRRCEHPQAEWDSCRRNGAPGQNEQRCAACALHSRHEIGNVRHLLYFVCPAGANGVWQWNIDQLLRRIELFNGKRVCAVVANGPPIKRPRMRSKPLAMDSVEAVKALLEPHRFEFLEFTNHPGLGEVVAWRELWSKVLPGQPGDVAFYAHAKGIRRGFEHPTAMKWTEAMYETCLDRWPLAQDALKKYPIVGSFKKVGFCFPGHPSKFHYSGTFFWTRLQDFGKRQWSQVPRSWGGTEMLPGILFEDNEAGCLFHSAFGTHMELYSKPYWDAVVQPALECWRGEHPLALP